MVFEQCDSSNNVSGKSKINIIKAGSVNGIATDSFVFGERNHTKGSGSKIKFLVCLWLVNWKKELVIMLKCHQAHFFHS